MPRTKSPPVTGYVEPLQHTDYAEVQKICACPVCHDWRTARAKFYAFNPDAWKKVERGETVINHSRACKCATCVNPKFIKARTAYLGATERWNLWTESCWHASSEPETLGEAYLLWLKEVLADREARSNGWWEGRSPYLPIQFWISSFKADMRKESEKFSNVVATISGIPKAAMELSANLLTASGLFSAFASGKPAAVSGVT